MKSSTNPLVSVLMTAYNRERYIADAIQSVLDSTYTNLELIIVDDRSSDRTVEIASDFAKRDSRIRLYVNEINLGDYPNRNEAAVYATGKYLKYLDSDDKIFATSLQVFVEAMELNEDCAFALSLEEFPIGQGKLLKVDSETALYYFFTYKGIFHTGPTGSIIRHDVFKKVGGFSGKQFISDLELWIKLTKVASILVLPGKLIYWREHEGQQMSLGQSTDEQFVRTIKLTHKHLFAYDLPLGLNKKLNSIYTLYRYLIIKFFMINKERGLKYAFNVYKRILS